MLLEGLYTSLATPFNNGSINRSALELLIERQIQAGIDGVITCYENGKTEALTNQNYQQIMQWVSSIANHRIKCIASIRFYGYSNFFRLTTYAKQANFDAVLLNISGLDNDNATLDYYLKIADNSALPIILSETYYAQNSSIINYLSQFSQHQNIIGIVNNSTDIIQMAELLANKPKNIEILSTQDKLILPYLAVGGSGVISTCANIVPRLIVDLYTSYISAQVDQAKQIYQRLLPLAQVLQNGNTLNSIWSALRMMDIAVNEPNEVIKISTDDQLSQALRKLVLLD